MAAKQHDGGFLASLLLRLCRAFHQLAVEPAAG